MGVSPKLRLVKNAVDLETVAAVERLLALAKAGRLIGLAYIALEPGSQLTADVLGTITSYSLVARGMCRELEDLIKLRG